MRNDRGPRPGQSSVGGQRAGGRPGGGSPKDTIKAALSATGGVAYVSAVNPGPDFLDRDAREQAERFGDLRASQLRRFYGMATSFMRRIETDDELTEGDVQAQMAYLKAASAYAAMRGQPEELVSFFTKHANSVKNREHFTRFYRHFEAVVAYHRLFAREG
jgi:CRISPR-associated protein Csm2